MWRAILLALAGPLLMTLPVIFLLVRWHNVGSTCDGRLRGGRDSRAGDPGDTADRMGDMQ